MKIDNVYSEGWTQSYNKDINRSHVLPFSVAFKIILEVIRFMSVASIKLRLQSIIVLYIRQYTMA